MERRRNVVAAGVLIVEFCCVWQTQVRAQLPCESAKVEASDGERSDNFGTAVALSGDRLVVGADDNERQGAAYVYDWDGVQWNESAKLVASDGQYDDHFGYAVALLGDRIAVGSPFGGRRYTGAVYVFERRRERWVEIAKLIPDDNRTGGYYMGQSLALSEDRVFAGASGDDDLGSNAGAVYVFRLNEGQWSQEAKLTASDGARVADFGETLAHFENRLVIGAPYDDGMGEDSGAAYVFEWDGSAWVERVKLQAENGSEFDRAGESLAMSNDRILMGAPGTSTSHVFRKEADTWIHEATLAAADGHPYLGRSAAFVGDRILLGSSLEWGQLSDTGNIYVFARQNEEWIQETVIPSREDSRFGSALCAFGGDVLIGDPKAANWKGVACLFTFAGADCNGNDLPDSCDLYSGSSDDSNANGVPDECEPGCGRIAKASCKDRNGVNQLKVILTDGVEGDSFTVTLTDGSKESGTINSRGKGKARFNNRPLGDAGTATAEWGCGAEDEKAYSCP